MPIRSRARALTSLAGVCAIVIGIVAGCGTAGPAATSTVSPSPLATASPSQSATAATTASGPTSLMDSPEGGDLPAGAYYLDLPAYPARIDFEVPAGWWHFWPGATRQASDAHAILVNSLETGAANGSAWGVAFTVVGKVPVDPCDPAAGFMDPSATRSADALADARRRRPSRSPAWKTSLWVATPGSASRSPGVRRQRAKAHASTRPRVITSGRSSPSLSLGSTSSPCSTSRALSWSSGQLIFPAPPSSRWTGAPRRTRGTPRRPSPAARHARLHQSHRIEGSIVTFARRQRRSPGRPGPTSRGGDRRGIEGPGPEPRS